MDAEKSFKKTIFNRILNLNFINEEYINYISICHSAHKTVNCIPTNEF